MNHHCSAEVSAHMDSARLLNINKQIYNCETPTVEELAARLIPCSISTPTYTTADSNNKHYGPRPTKKARFPTSAESIFKSFQMMPLENELDTSDDELKLLAKMRKIPSTLSTITEECECDFHQPQIPPSTSQQVDDGSAMDYYQTTPVSKIHEEFPYEQRKKLKRTFSEVYEQQTEQQLLEKKLAKKDLSSLYNSGILALPTFVRPSPYYTKSKHLIKPVPRSEDRPKYIVPLAATTPESFMF